MDERESLKIFKALSDGTRFKIVEELLNGKDMRTSKLINDNS